MNDLEDASVPRLNPGWSDFALYHHYGVQAETRVLAHPDDVITEVQRHWQARR